MTNKAYASGTVIDSGSLNDFNTATYNLLSAVAGTNTITATGPLSFTAYGLGKDFEFIPAVTNTGAVTININGLGARAITKYGSTALVTGDLVAGVVAKLVDDGTRFQLINPQVVDVAHGGTGQTTANSAFLALSSGVTLGLRNKLFNALGTLNQRNYSSGTATTLANQYTVDRWRVVTSGQNLTYAVSGIINTMTAPAGGLEQVIEGVNIEGGVYTLSWTGTASATVNGSAITNGGQTATLPAGSNVTVRFTGGTVSLPQFEKGTSATPFEYRPFGLETSLCQRYYYRIAASSTGQSFGTGMYYASTSASVYITFPTTMRAIPAVSVGSFGSWQGLNGSSVVGLGNGSNGIGSSPAGTEIIFTAAAASTAGSALILRAGTVGNFVAADAEL